MSTVSDKVFLALRSLLVAGLICQGACQSEAINSSRIASASQGSGKARALQTSDVVAGETLKFSVQEGEIGNAFIRRGPVAAHIVQSSGRKPRLIIAFPAGNSAVGLWFKPTAQPAEWLPPERIQPVKHVSADGLELYGIRARIAVEAESLLVEQAVLGSVRLLRKAVAPELMVEQPTYQLSGAGRQVTWQRSRADGNSRYLLQITLQEGSLKEDGDGRLMLTAEEDGVIEAVVLAMSGDTPLQPIPISELLNQQAGDDQLSRQVLAFLSYKEKLLAGSWRFLTYFGRDTLLSVRLLMSSLTPSAIEAAIASVLNRTDKNGEVAHEEDIADLAVIRNQVERKRTSAEPLFNYHMIDDDFMLAAVVAEYLLNHPENQLASFLARKSGNGETYARRLATNFQFVLSAAEKFASDPVISHLIAIKSGEPTGNWRDSQEGLANGRFPYDVNAVLVPAALNAIADLCEYGVLRTVCTQRLARNARTMAKSWEQHAPPFFRVTLSYREANEKIQDYADSLGIPAEQAIASLDAERLSFNAIALDKTGEPIPVLQSDDGYTLLFGKPSEEALRQILTSMMRPFPAGLLTPVGLLVANPAYADEGVRSLLTQGSYHGTVVWPWHHAMLALGIARQLRRDGISQNIRQKLLATEKSLWLLIDANRDIRTSELWSWSYRNGRYVVTPFGQHSEHKTESNAAQLWSTVFLGIPRPSRHPAGKL